MAASRAGFPELLSWNIVIHEVAATEHLPEKTELVGEEEKQNGQKTKNLEVIQTAMIVGSVHHDAHRHAGISRCRVRIR